jgi:hypothetical protein
MAEEEYLYKYVAKTVRKAKMMAFTIPILGLLAFSITFYFSYYLTSPYYNTRMITQPKYEDINIALSRIEKGMMEPQFRNQLPPEARSLSISKVRFKELNGSSIPGLKFTVDVYDYAVLDTLSYMISQLFTSETLLDNMEFKRIEMRTRLKEILSDIALSQINLEKMITCSPDSIAKMENALLKKKIARNKVQQGLINSDRMYNILADFYRNEIPLGHSIIPSFLVMLATVMLTTVLIVIGYRNR